MIEKMLKTDLVCLAQDREQALEQLRALEIMHLELPSRVDSDQLGELRKRLEQLEDCINVLTARKSEKDDFDYSEQTLELMPRELSKRVHQLIVNLERRKVEREHWLRNKQNLAPWGNFDPALVKRLRDQGMTIAFCAALDNQLPDLPDGCVMQEISRIENRIFFIVICDEKMDTEPLPLIQVSMDESMEEIDNNLVACDNIISQTEKELARLSVFLPKVKTDYQECLEKIEFHEARNAMGETPDLVYISGYIPVEREDELRQAAHEHGWALQLQEAERDNPNVPTLIRVPKWLQISKPIFEFVGIQPGYDEFDISAWFLVFLTIFFAMIFGDAGYGALFLVGTIAAKVKFGGKFRTQLNLLLLFSITTIIWGVMTGSYFGIAPNLNLAIEMPKGLPWFNVEDNLKNERIMFICFVLGAIHLSVAHVWKTVISINTLRSLSQVGWLLFVWANALLAALMVSPTGSPIADNLKNAPWVMPVLITMYVVASVLIILFSAPSRNPLAAVGKGFGEFLGNSVNSFVDVVSYIRLFAVGLSSFYVANSFNLIAAERIGFDGVAMVGAVLVILFGHTLNIALCLLGVLVHGIRLNTLEFSGHMGLEWKGIAFRPFARRLKERIVQ